jgi:hypothetical protein
MISSIGDHAPDRISTKCQQRQPRLAAVIAATSVIFIPIIASNACFIAASAFAARVLTEALASGRS